MGTWTNFPMAAGQYCTRDKKYIEELYLRFTQIELQHTYETITWVSNRYITGWKLHVLDRGTVAENAIKYLREKIVEGLETWWFWNDGNRPFFVHAVKEDVLNDVIGQPDWTNEAVKLGTHAPYPILDEMYRVIDWIAKNIYVRKTSYGVSANGARMAYYNGNYNGVGPQTPWDTARAAFTGQVADICDGIPNSHAYNASYWNVPFALIVLYRYKNPGDFWNTNFTFTGFFSLAIQYNISLNIREDLWGSASRNATVIKMWWDGLSNSMFLGSFSPIPIPSGFQPSNNVGVITVPIKIGGVLQGNLNDDGDRTWQEQILDVTPGDFDFTSGSVFQYDMNNIALKNQLYVPPDKAEDITVWATPVVFIIGDWISNDSVIYRCISAHTSSATDEPGVGVNWETYWELDSTPGWYRGDVPGALPDTTQSQYGWCVPRFKGFMIRPIWPWI